MPLPAVSEIYLPQPAPAPDKDAEFGMILLEDGSAGLYYAWLSDAQQGMNARFSTGRLARLTPMELAEYFRSEAEDRSSLGLAAINAITSCAWRRAGYTPPPAPDSLGALAVTRNDHIGMVGYFPALVKRLRARRVQLTVIEKKAQFLSRPDLPEVTLDPGRLRACNKILISATTLLNNTLEEILRYSGHAEHITVLGPTAGFFPDPLFGRGITAVGGTWITDAATALGRLRRGASPGDAARKFLVTRNSYPAAR